MSNCHCNTGITLDGSGQLGRYLKALDPSYAPIDGCSIEDLLLFAKRYAGQIRFYDIPESHINDGIKPEKVSWREFFRRDMAVIAASVAVLNISDIKKEYDELRERLDADPSPEKFAALFTISIGMATRIDRWYSVAIPKNPLRTDLDLAINAHLRWQMKHIMAYEDGYKFIDSKNPLKIDYSGIENDELWGLKDTVNPDAGIYQGSTLDDKIRNAALYADDIFNDFYSTLQSFINKGPDYMAFALEQYPAHQPHMALFIAFLQIFKLAQEQINGLTGKMLDFYYKEVLQLTPKDSIPDKTHIIFELAKDIAQYDLATGTGLSAGKDASGKEQVYKTATDLVLNQAKVKELKTIFIQKKDPVDPKTSKSIRSIYASPVANSADGYGTAFTEANPKWPTFGKGMSANTLSANICKSLDAIKENLLTAPAVQTGFAIASPQLVLQGGKRLIALKVPGISAIVGNAITALLTNPFEIWLSGEKEWLKVDKVMPAADLVKFMQMLALGVSVFHPGTDAVETAYFIDAEKDTIYVYLPIAEKAVVAYDAKLHTGYNYKTAYPVMQVMLNEEMRIDEEVYNSIKATNLSLEIKVGSINPGRLAREKILSDQKIVIPEYSFDGLETVVIQTAEGLFPSDKPFNPFTQYPGPGKSLYIGSEEIFNKPLGKLAVNLKRTQQHLDKGSQSSGIKPLGVSVLTNRSWKELTTAHGTDFEQVDLTENILIVVSRLPTDGAVTIIPVPLQRTPIETVTEYKNQVSKGFLRIDYLLQLDNNDGQLNNMQASQDLAPQQEIKEISVNYHSALAQLDSAIDQVFHVYPFGVVETYFDSVTGIIKNPGIVKSSNSSFSALDKQKGYLMVNANNLLLPQYTFLDAYSAYTGSSEANVAGGKYAAGKKNVLRDLVLASSGIKEIVQGGNNQYSSKLQQQGMLFIGLEKAVPMQSLTLLFQFAEGSAEDEDNDPPPIQWSYLTNNEWRPMRGEDIVSDGTYGFQTTGIVKLNIPADATSNNTIITEGLHWFAVSVSENAHRIPQLVNVVAQAAEVVFDDNDNDQKHFDAALPAGSITKLSVKVAQVSKVEQPFASFDGKHKEISKEFYTRVSERLRHKNRAINSWDYEHLVLNRFPSVYKVKCITATDPNCLCRQEDVSKKTREVVKVLHFPNNLPAPQRVALLAEMNNALNNNSKLLIEIVLYAAVEYEIPETYLAIIQKAFAKAFPGINFNRFSFSTSSKIAPDSSDAILYLPVETACCGPQVAPGHVLLVPIANLKNRNSINPLQPKTSRRVLLEIEEYIKKLTSPFVKVHAKNPVYEQVIVGFKVQFYTGTDKGFYLKKLNDEIVQYLTPWAFDENADVQFGQKIYASSIINFIEERPYVDFITDFAMGVCKDECCKPVTVAATRLAQPLREAAAIGSLTTKMDETAAMQLRKNAIFAAMEAPAAAAAGSVVQMRGLITDSKTGNPIAGAGITVTGTAININTTADGRFSVDLDPSTAILKVEASGYKDVEAAVAGLSEFRLAMIRSEEQDESITEILAGICGCDDIETQMGKEAAERGEIVAKPSTARSILVSVPQHVIIPYSAPVKETPCDVRKKNKPASVAKIIGATVPSPPESPAEAKPVPPEEPVKDTIKDNKATAKDEIKAVTGIIIAEPVKPTEPAKDLTGAGGTKNPDLVKSNPALKTEELQVKKPLDAIKDVLVKGITKIADEITAKPLIDKVAIPAEIIKTELAGIRALPVTKVAEIIKKKSAMPAKAVTKAAKPVVKTTKAAATGKPKKNNK